MTTILPGARTPWDVIGEKIHQNVSQNLPGAVQQGFQRQMGLNALDQAKGEIAQAGGDPLKIALALSRMAISNPEAARALGPIAQTAIPLAQKTSAAGPVNSAIQGIGGMAAQGAQQAAQPQIQSQQNQPMPSPNVEKQGQGIFLNQFVPQNVGELISPEQKSDILSNVASRGGDVAFARQQIDDYNQGKIGINDLVNSNVEKKAANVQRMLGFETQIKDKIDKYVPENTSEAEKNIYYNMLRPALESSETFSDAWQKVSANIDNFRKLNEAYVNRIPDPQVMGVSPAAEKQLRESAKPIIKADPLAYNILEQAYLQKGHSPITPAQILKPLPEQVKSTLSKAQDYKDLVYPTYLGNDDFEDRRMQKNIEKADMGQKKEIPAIASSLRNQWNQDLSLLNIYTELRKKGWSLYNIDSLLDDVSDKFSSRQQAERAMLNQNVRIPIRYLSE